MGIDTLKIQLDGYEVGENSDITIQDNHTIHGGESLPLFSIGNSDYQGSKAFVNDDKFNLTLNPHFRDEHNQSMGFVSFSVPKTYYNDNFLSVGLGGMQGVVNEIENSLLKHGVKTDLSKGKIARIDNFNNILMEHKTIEYFPVLKVLDGKRIHSRDFGSTITWGNSQCEFCIYDKIQEMVSKGKKIEKRLEGKNVLRMESRLFKNRNIERKYHIITMKDLYEKYYDVKIENLKMWKDRIFNVNVDAFSEKVMKNYGDKIRYYSEKYRYWIDKFIYGVGVIELQKQIGIDEFFKMVKSMGVGRQGLYYQKNKVKKSILEMGIVREFTYRDLYSEMITKLEKEIREAS